MKSEINMKKEGDKLGLVLTFSEISGKEERSELEQIFDRLFLQSVGPITWDISSENLGEAKCVDYIGKTSLFFGNTIQQNATYFNGSAKVTVETEKGVMLNYLKRLARTNKVEVNENYVNMMRDLN